MHPQVPVPALTLSILALTQGYAIIPSLMDSIINRRPFSGPEDKRRTAFMNQKLKGTRLTGLTLVVLVGAVEFGCFFLNWADRLPASLIGLAIVVPHQAFYWAKTYKVVEGMDLVNLR